MNEDRVTVDGVVGARPEREAMTGAQGRVGEGGRRRRGGRGRGEQRMVPDDRPTSYYGRPVLKAPVWEARDIAGYFFVGGLAGASAVVGALGQATDRPVTARAAKLAAVGCATLSAAALVHDLGKPSRFYNMLRVLKPTSPMSVGSWLLAGFGPAAGIASLTDLSGRAPRIGVTATVASAVLGSAVATYTAVLAADTAVPAWHDGYAQMPFVFAASAASAAAGLVLMVAPPAETMPMRRLAVASAIVEQASFEVMTRSMGSIARPYHEDRPGRMLRAARVLTIGGAAGAGLFGNRRPVAVSSGAALLVASALTRFGIFHAGVASSQDPEATTVPQRQRLDERNCSKRLVGDKGTST